MEAHNNSLASLPFSCLCLWWGRLSWGVRVEMKYHVINSRIPPPPLPPSRSSCFIFVCRAKRTSVRLPLQRMAEHPPFLKIGCAERGLKIDPPLITVSLKYLSATATFKHHSLSWGFYNPYHIPVLVMEIPTICLTCFEFILFPLHGHTLFISLFQF